MMKKIRSILAPFLIVSITLSLVTGYGFIMRENKVSAASTIKVKAASDFTLYLPKNWKNHYVIKKSKTEKNGSYVAFFSKKCYKEKKEGWLFSIMRYKDQSYEDLPSYELVGMWNKYNYVAVFPSDVQTEGATKKAKQEYRKLDAGSMEAATSIKPVKNTRKGKNVFRVSDFSLLLPDNWADSYVVEKKKTYVSFCAKKCYEEIGQGSLFSIGRYTDISYQEIPDYELVGMWNGVYYVAEFPTDVQFIGASQAAIEQYTRCERSVKKVARSIRP